MVDQHKWWINKQMHDQLHFWLCVKGKTKWTNTRPLHTWSCICTLNLYAHPTECVLVMPLFIHFSSTHTSGSNTMKIHKHTIQTVCTVSRFSVQFTHSKNMRGWVIFSVYIHYMQMHDQLIFAFLRSTLPKYSKFGWSRISGRVILTGRVNPRWARTNVAYYA